MKLIESVALGLKRHPRKSISEFFLAYCALWTLVESVSHFFPKLNFSGERYYISLLTVSLIIAIFRSYQQRSFHFKVGHSNTKIAVLFGDLFEREGHLAIPVNEFFDSELGQPVSPKSLHGIVLSRFFAGHPASFDKLVSEDLASRNRKSVPRTKGNTDQFEIGTTASIRTNTHKFLLFAICSTDLVTLKASADLTSFVRALEGLCSRARNVLGGEKLVVPLVGSGLSGVGLPANQLLELILLVLVNETKKNQVAREIEVIIHPDRFEEIDLASIETFWR
jgi:hypothetical protein